MNLKQQFSYLKSMNAFENLNAFAWHHWVISRRNGTFYALKDGILLQQTSHSTNLTASNFRIGGYTSGFDLQYVGYLQEMRITKGFCRYTENYEVPTTPFFRCAMS